jgi:hypothetical protein
MYVDQWGEIHPPPDPEKAKPRNPQQLGGTLETGVSIPSGVVQKVARYGTGKARNREMAAFALQLEPRGNRRLAAAMYDCCSFLGLSYYPGSQRSAVSSASTCKKHLLCPVCAILRGGKMLKRYQERIEHIAPQYDFELVTLTVKNGSDLWERFQHLKHAFKRLRVRGRDGYGSWAPVAGAIWSTEFTRSAEGWHPHLHIVAAKPKGSEPFRYGKGSALALDWESVTSDSFIVHAAPINPDPEHLPAALCEVLKYAVKFGDLSLEDNFHAYQTLRGKRLIQSSGCFYGLELPDDAELTDDPLAEASIEYFFRYASTGYQLINVHSTNTPEGTQ